MKPRWEHSSDPVPHGNIRLSEAFEEYYRSSAPEGDAEDHIGAGRVEIAKKFRTALATGELRAMIRDANGSNLDLSPDIWDGADDHIPLVAGCSAIIHGGCPRPVFVDRESFRKWLQPGEQPHAQPGRGRAQRAIAALYPTGVPDQYTLANKVLCGAVNDWLQRKGLQTASRDTILRAGGRRK